MIAKWLLVGLAAVLGAGVANQIWYERRRRSERRALKSEIGKWEDEGGNVPHVRGNEPQPGSSNAEPAT